MTIKYCLLILILFPLLLNAQDKLPNNMFLHKLSNGLDVLVVEDNSVPLATVAMTFKNGAYTEPIKYSGMTYIYHNMLFKANTNYGNAEVVAFRTSQLGLLKGVVVNEENAECYFTLPSINVEEGLRYMNSAIRFPILSPDELEKEKSISDKELQVKESNPLFHLNEVTGQHLWGSLYTRKMAIGGHVSIQSATLGLIDSVRKKYYYPNNALLVVAGNVLHDKIFKKIDELYSSWLPSTFNSFKKWPVPEFKPLAKTEYFTVQSNSATVPYILISWQGPDTRKDVASTYAADVFSYILTQNSSRLNKALVQTGLAIQISFSYLTLSHGGPISFFIKPNPQKIKECMAEVKRQINLFDADDYVTVEQIETAKRKLEINQIRQQEITSDYVHTLSFWWASASFNYFFTYLDNLAKIKKTDLQMYVRKYIKNRPYCAGLLISPAMKAQLNTDGFFNIDN